MKRVLVFIVMVVIAVVFTTGTASAKTNDYQRAVNWANNHGGGYTIEKVITVANGGYKVKVKGTKWTVKYPIIYRNIEISYHNLRHTLIRAYNNSKMLRQKVKKGKKVACYMIEKNGDVCAMVCCGKVK